MSDKLSELLKWFIELNWDIQMILGIVLVALVLTRVDTKKAHR